MLFPQFPNGDFEEKISLHENVEGEFQYDVNIGWQLHQVSYNKLKSGISISKRCLGAVQCNNNELNFKICRQLGHFKHKGTHTHGIFEALHDTMEVLNKVEECVLEFPSETAYALKIGTSIICPQQPARPMRLISKALHRHGKIKHYHRNYLTKAVPGIAVRVNLNKHLILMDVTYDCFPKGYYLCSTNVFFEELGKFGVIFQAVIDGLSAEHFKAYFLAFFHIFGTVIGHMDKEIDINFSGLFDISR
ncbi:hypothetical protein INT45_001808 [Circinella minor]|uniref:Uncharacterized protein n=1 Tax=Circinella minor TaxID=1195481 RepID=A0A8H7RNI1_9FUNG|nr:hypothetical protein INT45_001808 [Circinella minor]